MFLTELKDLHKFKSPADLGIDLVYRTEFPDPYYKGLSIWGVGKYFSLSKEDSEKISTNTNSIKSYKLDDSLKLLKFDLTWKTDSDRSDKDYELVHSLINKVPKGIDGYVILSNSMQYGYSQVVIFPKAISKVHEVKR